MKTIDRLELIPIPGIPLVHSGDDLAHLLVKAAREAGIVLADDDILVVAQKIVSKAEGRRVRLSEVTPSARARALAEITQKPAELVEVVLWDAAEVIRARRDLLIVEHKLGFISANAGVDHSNVGSDPDLVLRLPNNPDASALVIRERLAELLNIKPPILIIDSHGRAWRFGTVGVVIGLSGLAPVHNLRGTRDLYNRSLRHTEVGFTDQIAAAASLVMGQAAEGCPAVVVRGLPFSVDDEATAADVLRPKETDLFR